MSPDFSPPETPQPLSIGNVVTASLRLYRDHFKAYLGVSAQATLWAVLPILAAITVVVFFVNVRDYYSTLGLIIPAWIGLILYCSAKYLSHSAAIARLAFTELISQPESATTAQKFALSRMWSFLGAGLLVGLIFFVLAFGLYLTGALVIGIPAALVLAGSASSRNFQGIFIIGLIALLYVLVALGIVLWLSARFAITEVPLAIEPEVTAVGAIGRSWELTQSNVFRIILILTVAVLVSVPFVVIVQVIAELLERLISQVVDPRSFSGFVLILLMTYVLGLIAGIFTTPFWQAIKAVIYYDLRSRREGLGLQLRSQEF
jgi:hypothetical protein